MVRQAFIAQSAPSFGFFVLVYVTGIPFRTTYRLVAVTDDAVYVLDSTARSGGASPQAVAGVLPRATVFGPTSGTWTELTLLGSRHWVHRRFYDQLAQADAAASGA